MGGKHRKKGIHKKKKGGESRGFGEVKKVEVRRIRIRAAGRAERKGTEGGRRPVVCVCFVWVMSERFCRKAGISQTASFYGLAAGKV